MISVFTVFAVAVCLLMVGSTQAAFSVSYFAQSEHPQVVNGGFVSSTQLSAVQVADLYNRLSGFEPLLSEEKEDLPSIDPLTVSKVRPILLEIFGSELPESVTPVLRSQFQGSDRSVGPSAQAVKEILQSKGVDARVAVYLPVEGQSVHSWILAHAATQPVVILHHTTTTGVNHQRQLSTTTGAKHHKTENSVAELTEFQISEYQICLWTGVGLVLLVLAAVRTITHMEVIPDSLLYAKFQSGRTGRSD